MSVASSRDYDPGHRFTKTASCHRLTVTLTTSERLTKVLSQFSRVARTGYRCTGAGTGIIGTGTTWYRYRCRYSTGSVNAYRKKLFGGN